MWVTEQTDARGPATDPVHYLIVPRVWATVLTLPLLIVVADVVGIAGGYLISVGYFGANPVTYMGNTFQFMDLDDVTSGLISLASADAPWSAAEGLHTRGGAGGGPPRRCWRRSPS
jgi:phospholipid/cholesterol/gamma-HCH transport system permease protein